MLPSMKRLLNWFCLKINLIIKIFLTQGDLPKVFISENNYFRINLNRLIAILCINEKGKGKFDQMFIVHIYKLGITECLLCYIKLYGIFVQYAFICIKWMFKVYITFDEHPCVTSQALKILFFSFVTRLYVSQIVFPFSHDGHV